MAEAAPTTTTENEQQPMGKGAQTSAASGNVDLSRLQFLSDMDSMLIKQPMRAGEWLMEMCCGCEMENLYQAFKIDPATKTSTHLFDLKEESSCIARQCCGANRPLELNAVAPDSGGDASTAMFQVLKPYRAGCFCLPATMMLGRNYMEVAVNGAILGSVREKCMCNCKIGMEIYDNQDNLLCELERCCCACECAGVAFHILDANGEETEYAVTKEAGGIIKELFTTNDNFTVQFPPFMNTIPKKLLLITAAMFIEFKYFENKPDK